MKKLLFALILFCSCRGTTEEKAAGISIVYLKDPSTNLCFSAVHRKDDDPFYDYTISCVPCDSLNNVKIYLLNQSK